jgi:hypothetical protein
VDVACPLADGFGDEVPQSTNRAAVRATVRWFLHNPNLSGMGKQSLQNILLILKRILLYLASF